MVFRSIVHWHFTECSNINHIIAFDIPVSRSNLAYWRCNQIANPGIGMTSDGWSPAKKADLKPNSTTCSCSLIFADNSKAASSGRRLLLEGESPPRITIWFPSFSTTSKESAISVPWLYSEERSSSSVQRWFRFVSFRDRFSIARWIEKPIRMKVKSQSIDHPMELL